MVIEIKTVVAYGMGRGIGIDQKGLSGGRNFPLPSSFFWLVY